MSSSWSALHAQLVRSTERVSFQRSFDLMRIHHPELLGFRDAVDLLDHQHRPGGDADGRNAVLTALARETTRASPLTEAAVTLLILALWPGLDAVHGRLVRHFRREPDRLAAEIIARVTIGARRLDLTRVSRIAATLVRNVERDLRRQIRRDRRLAARDQGPAADPPDPRARPDQGHGADLLRSRLVRLIGDDADLVIAVAVEGDSQAEAALRLGISHDAARKRYQRAVKRLRHELAA